MSSFPLHRRQIRALRSSLILLLAGCASSQVPLSIREAPADQVSLHQAQRDSDRLLGRRVRWGGTIIKVHNRKRTTEIEVLSRPLDKGGKPREKEPGQGRFLALLSGFADPVEYPEQRLITLTGRLERAEIRPVGDYPYAYPVIAVEQPYLWPEPPPSPPPYYYPYPWYYPWYSPWDPWGRPWYW